MSLLLIRMLSLAGLGLLQVQACNTPSLDWSQLIGAAGDDGPWDLAMNDGNIIVTGDSTGALVNGSSNMGSLDIFIMAFSTTGDRLWTVQRGSSGHDLGHALAVDSAGNNIIAGYTNGSLDGFTSEGDDDIFVMKFSKTGSWEWTYQTGSSGVDHATGVVADGTGNLFISATGNHSHVIKLLSGGTVAWSWLSDTNGTYGATAIALTSDGDIIAGFQTTYGGVLVRKLLANGNPSWTFSRGTYGNHVRSIALDGSGDIVIAGDTGESLDGWTFHGVLDIMVMGVGADGTWQWTYQAGTDAWDEADDVVVNKDGYIFVTGTMEGGHHMYVRKLQRDGTGASVLWTWQKGSGPGLAYHAATGVEIDEAGNIYIAGYSDVGLDGYTHGGIYDIYVAKLLDVEICTASRASKGSRAENVVKAALAHGIIAAMLVLMHG